MEEEEERGGGFCWCQLVPRTLRSSFSSDVSQERRTSAHREPCVRFTITAFHLGLTSPACLLPLPVLTCSYKPPPSVRFSFRHRDVYPTAFPHAFQPPSRAEPRLQLTRVAPLWLRGHRLAAGTLSHATAPGPSGLPGPPSPGAPPGQQSKEKKKPKATSASFHQTWSWCSSGPSRRRLALVSPSRSLQPVRLGLSLPESLALKHKHTRAR